MLNIVLADNINDNYRTQVFGVYDNEESAEQECECIIDKFSNEYTNARIIYRYLYNQFVE